MVSVCNRDWLTVRKGRPRVLSQGWKAIEAMMEELWPICATKYVNEGPSGDPLFEALYSPREAL